MVDSTSAQNRLILASGSTYKRELMERLGLPFESIASYVDESRHEGETPEAMAVRLATAKAVRVRADHSGAWVVGADQVIHRGSTLFNKPGTPAQAARQLSELSGGEHTLLTAVALARPVDDSDGSDGVRTDVVRFTMNMRPLTPAQIEAYVDEDQPLDCAGSYKVESAGIRLFRSMDGDDYTAIVGLPLTRVWSLLESTGYFDDGTT
jgi:septum formation protein